MDKFRIETIAATPNPQQVIWAAMHQDYSEGFIWDDLDKFPDETKAGELIIKHLLSGNKGHYGPVEHPQITLNVGYFPHSMMQQIRTHRVGVSFDVQCLAGDTEITFVKTSGSLQKIKIADLYDLRTNGEQKSDRGKSFFKTSLRVLNEGTGNFEIGRVRDVISSGIQPVYRLTLENGKVLDCTTNHQILTTAGWQKMGEAVGLVADFNTQAVALQKDCFVLCNGVFMTNREPCSSHASFAEETGNWNVELKLRAHPVKAIAVKYLGLQETYDLEVAGDFHNFVANGIVVHNSFRYTGQRIVDVAEGKQEVEDVFYLRPVGKYTNRQGKRYFYSQEQRDEDLEWCLKACQHYQKRIEQGLSEEHARGLIPFDARQHFVLSCNARSLMHLLDLRWKKDAQLEAQQFCELLFDRFQEWCPALAQWYQDNRAKKARLSP